VGLQLVLEDVGNARFAERIDLAERQNDSYFDDV
jgi:hypothetical protein